MKVGDIIIHPKYGKGEITKIGVDQITCWIAGGFRAFTPSSCEEFHRAASEKGQGIDFNRKAESYPCGFCSGSFTTEKGMLVHQSQCKENPAATQWVRTKVKPEEAGMAKKGVKSKRSSYTDEEKAFIADNYGKLPMEDLARKLGIRVNTLQGYVYYLRKIGRMPPSPDHARRSAIYKGTKVIKANLNETTIPLLKTSAPEKKHHPSGMAGETAKHVESRSEHTRGIVRNVLTAHWLAFMRQERNINLTLNQIKADFTDFLFKEYSI